MAYSSRIRPNVDGWLRLPAHVRAEFERLFADNPQAARLQRQAEEAERARNYVLAMNTYKTLDEARLLAQRKLLQEQTENVTLLQMGLSEEELNKVNILTIAMYMACDIIEYFVTDVNEILRKKDPTARFEMFDPILDVGKKARENMEYLLSHTSMFDTDCFVNNSDNMRDMLLNKAKKVYKEYAKVVAAKETS